VNVSRAELLISCARPSQFPETGLPEVAFLGRSNVGKSSLLNALAQRKALARTSSTPGKTRLIHFFEVTRGRQDLLLVDLPGYGFAKVPERERRGWQKLIESYLEDRPPLKVAVLLQDLRRDFTDDETLLLEWLAERGVQSLVAFTKCDKFKPMRRKQRVGQLKQQVARPPGGFVTTSADKRIGVDELWRAIYAMIQAPG
jgi:GTP-binding protein